MMKHGRQQGKNLAPRSEKRGRLTHRKHFSLRLLIRSRMEERGSGDVTAIESIVRAGLYHRNGRVRMHEWAGPTTAQTDIEHCAAFWSTP